MQAIVAHKLQRVARLSHFVRLESHTALPSCEKRAINQKDAVANVIAVTKVSFVRKFPQRAQPYPRPRVGRAKALKPRRRQLRVAHRVLDIPENRTVTPRRLPNRELRTREHISEVACCLAPAQHRAADRPRAKR